MAIIDNEGIRSRRSRAKTRVDTLPPPPDSGDWTISKAMRLFYPHLVGQLTLRRRSNAKTIVHITEKLDFAIQEYAESTCSKPCICKVPRHLREGDDDGSYVPQIVSIGPYHHENKRLQYMDQHKWRSLNQILKRTGHDVMTYWNALKVKEGRIRACYEGRIDNLCGNEIVEMMLLDGCFILEVIRGSTEGFEGLGYPKHDPIFAASSGWIHTIRRDLIMLENQLPLFVLELLQEIQDQKRNVSELALGFFDPLTLNDQRDPRDQNEPLTRSSSSRLESSPGPATTSDSSSADQPSLHLLDVFRKGLLGPGPRTEERQLQPGAYKRQQLQLIHCVTKLREAGVKFKRRETDRFWDVKFDNGILEIPKLLIHDGTKSLLLNLIAFEQYHLDCSSDITSYVIFMDNLINLPEDVGYLQHRDIIEHWLGSDAEVANLFTRLCQEVVFDRSKSYLSSTSDDVNEYCKHRRHHWRASLKHNYFNNPCAIISFIVVVISLVLTFVQTFYTVYGYYIRR